jgi:hypothetical protein
VTSDPRAFLTLDLGGATSSAALIGRIDGRWRLLGTVALPASVSVEPAIAGLLGSVRATDPALAAELRLPDEAGAADEALLPRLVATSVAVPRLAVLAGSARHLATLLGVAEASGWRATGYSPDATDPVALTAALLDRSVAGVLIGAAEPPAADERSGLTEAVRVVAAIAARRPEVDIVLAGAAAAHADRFGPDGPGAAERHLATAPSAGAGSPPGAPLRALLQGRRPGGEDARDAVARATASLAEVLDRRVETIEIGFDAGLRCVARSTGDGSGTDGSAAGIVAGAALVPPELDDGLLDGIIDWSTVPRDRHRLRDRLLDLRRDPWGDAAGDGALLRMAAARASVARLLAATRHLDRPEPPDLVVASGGVWAVAPGPAVTLALADVVRRPAVSQYAYDHARLLGPLGMIEDEEDRRRMAADLADDLLVPLGSVVIASGIRSSRDAGRLVVQASAASSELALVAGGLQLVDLPPGQLATAELSFRDPVTIGTRGRRFDVEVSGGLGGLLVDLRDIPLRLPERSERRRELLAAWQSALWAGIDS